MNNPFCFLSLPVPCAANGANRIYASSLKAETSHSQPGSKHSSQRNSPAAQRRPIVGEALIDTDGMVWLVESIKPLNDAFDFVTNVARVTQTGAVGNEPVSHHFNRHEFEAFCSAKGIVLLGS